MLLICADVWMQLCGARYLIAEKEIEGLVGPYTEELEKAATQTVWYDRGVLESLKDTTPLPDVRRNAIEASDTRTLVYTSGEMVGDPNLYYR